MNFCLFFEVLIIISFDMLINGMKKPFFSVVFTIIFIKIVSISHPKHFLSVLVFFMLIFIFIRNSNHYTNLFSYLSVCVKTMVSTCVCIPTWNRVMFYTFFFDRKNMGNFLVITSNYQLFYCTWIIWFHGCSFRFACIYLFFIDLQNYCTDMISNQMYIT